MCLISMSAKLPLHIVHVKRVKSRGQQNQFNHLNSLINKQTGRESSPINPVRTHLSTSAPPALSLLNSSHKKETPHSKTATSFARVQVRCV